MHLCDQFGKSPYRRKSGGIPPLFSNINTTWKRVLSFVALPLYPREKLPIINQVRRWVRYTASVDVKCQNECRQMKDTETWFSGLPVRSRITVRNETPRLHLFEKEMLIQNTDHRMVTHISGRTLRILGSVIQ